MAYAVLGVSILAFALALRWFGVVGLAGRAVSVAREAGAVMASKTLSDDEKEGRIQRATLSLFAAFFGLLLRAGGAFGVAAAILFAAQAAGLAAAQRVLALSISWPAILAATVVLTLAFWPRRR